MKHFLRQRFYLLMFGLLTIAEGITNTLLYLTFTEKIVGVADWAIPFTFNKLKDPYGN